MKFKVLVFFILINLLTPLALANEKSFVIIVHTSNPVQKMNRKYLADVFLKKVTFWDHDKLIIPVDLGSSSQVRKEFSYQVLKRPITAIRSYWQQMIFSGQAVQPLELDSESQVLQYVSSHPNAISYISSSAVLPAKVKVVNWD